MRAFLFALLLVLAPAAVASEADFKAAQQRFDAGDYQGAIVLYTKAIDSGQLDQKTLADAYYERGNTYRRLDRQQEAIADYRSAIHIEPNFYQAHYNMGNAYASLKQNEQAIAAYNQALRHKPDYFPALVNRGNRYLDMKQNARALADYDAAIKIKADFAIAWNNRGLALENLGRRQEAIASYRRAIALDPQYRTPRENLKRLTGQES
jgi:tetratricopeptide (TPR) repeat protein